MSVRENVIAWLRTAMLLLMSIGLAGWAGCGGSPSTTLTSDTGATADDFAALSGRDVERISTALDRIREDWPEGSVTMLVESLRYIQQTKPAFEVPLLLDEKANIRSAKDLEGLFRDIWKKEYRPHPNYAHFKAKLYARKDPLFEEYFHDDFPATIRLDEVRWGGVKRDGIPPLKDPAMLSVEEAEYLQDSNLVFGVYLNGEAKCYPKRILAWHEMVKDHVGGVSINGVYCTLCGSMIVYDTEFEGRHYELGTSGFLYRSNKLMYDHKTKSLWNTLQGEPVVGLLVGKGIKLKRYPVVTTTWGKWKQEHPDTKVLSLAALAPLNVDYQRDYSEGAAYRDYFATDDLMFGVPKMDARLKNKAEVLALVLENAPDESLAIAVDFLKSQRVHHDQLGGQQFVVLTDDSGASRVYETQGRKFDKWQDDSTVLDAAGNEWRISEQKLAASIEETQVELKRLPAHRAFWFGWYSAYPDTRLVK